MARTVENKSALRLALLAIAMLLIVCFARTQVAWGEDASIFAGGTGTESDPYLIEDATQLGAFRDSVNAGTTYSGEYVKLTQDVDISGAQWTPIGTSVRSGSGLASGSTPFEGTFDGTGHTVSGLTITQNGTQSQGDDHAIGFFGAVMGGTVENLMLADASVNCSSSELAGIAVGFLSSNGTVNDVSTSGSLKAECGCGAIVGKMTLSGTIADCTNAASVTSTGGSGNCGGIVGAAYYTAEGQQMRITNCTNTGAITGTNDVGGICGLCCGFVSDCKNEGAVTGSSYSVGGICGELKNYGDITHCTNSATVTNTATSSPYGTGGIVGWTRYDGAPPAYAASAPFAVTDNVNTGSVTTASSIGVGGIIGVLYSAGTVTGNENHAATLSGKQFIGGIVGNLQDQGASTLPSSITEGATVENNVSTTAVADMTGALTDQFAYNNDPSLFTVTGNGTTWVATRSSTGDTRYASLAYAAANAADDDTLTLIADSTETAAIEAPTVHDITLDLNGHSIQFAPDAGITTDGDTVTIEGSGDLYALDADGKIASSPKLFTVNDGAVVLKGGTYPMDVSAYVAPDYQVKTLDAPDAVENQYEVVPVDTTPAVPDEPAEPEAPAATTNPTPQPATDAQPAQKPVSGEPTPQLGDDMQNAAALILTIAALAAGMGAIAAFRLRKRA